MDPADPMQPNDQDDPGHRSDRLEPPGLLDQAELLRVGRAVGLGVLLGLALVLLGRRTHDGRTG